MLKAILDAQNISRSFVSGQAPIIEKLNLAVYEGEFLVIMGSSGSGKSTLLYLLSGLDQATRGTVYFKGEALKSFSEEGKAKFRRTQLGFVFQDNHLVANLTLLENVLISAYLMKKEKRSIRRKVIDLFEEVGLAKHAHKLPAQVSGGEQQRCALLRGIVNEPKVLMADEPTGNLNSHHSDQILNLMSDLHDKGQTIVMVTHDIKSACRGSRIIFLRDGAIVDELGFDNDLHDHKEAQLISWLKKHKW